MSNAFILLGTWQNSQFAHQIAISKGKHPYFECVFLFVHFYTWTDRGKVIFNEKYLNSVIFFSSSVGHKINVSVFFPHIYWKSLVYSLVYIPNFLKYVILCSTEQSKSYFGKTWVWVNDYIFFGFGWTIPFKTQFEDLFPTLLTVISNKHLLCKVHFQFKMQVSYFFV